MEASRFEETKFFAAVAARSARAILIGRRALIALGLPLLTRDYDFWIHGDDIPIFNAAVSGFDLFPILNKRVRLAATFWKMMKKWM